MKTFQELLSKLNVSKFLLNDVKNLTVEEFIEKTENHKYIISLSYHLNLPLKLKLLARSECAKNVLDSTLSPSTKGAIILVREYISDKISESEFNDNIERINSAFDLSDYIHYIQGTEVGAADICRKILGGEIIKRVNSLISKNNPYGRKKVH